MVSVLLLMVCFLALMPLTPASTRTLTWSTGHATWRSWSNTWSRTWSRTWGTTWHTSWSRTWSNTWSRRTHVHPTYTSTEYVPYPVPGCDPNDPYCNGYYQNPWCYPNNPYCNGYPQAQTVTTFPAVSQPVVTQLISQTVMLTETNPDFFLFAWPTTISLPPDTFVGSTNFVLTVTSVGGWSGEIQFITSALPQGITLSNLPPSTYQLNSPTAGWNIQVTIDASAQTGNYPIVITGLSGSLIHSVAVTISVSNPNGT